MTNPHDRPGSDADPQEQVRAALALAQDLAVPWVRGQDGPARFAQASQVGDMTVLALALRD